MKSALTVLLFPSLLIGVFADGEKLSVMEGDSVTLQTGLTDLQKDDEIRWRFGQEESLLAEINSTSDERFRNTHLDQTGSLTIRNITAEQSGLYEVEIIRTRSRYTVHRSFNVTVRDDVESVSVLEGDTVTLLTGLKETERIKQILWKSGDQLIADLNSPVKETWSNVYLNRTTGDLTISNVRNNQYNYYEVEIHTTGMIFRRKYLVTDATVSVSLMTGDSVTLHTGFNIIPGKNAVLWTDNQDKSFTQSTNINDMTGDFTIRNIQQDQSGIYTVNIIKSRKTMVLLRNFHVNINGVFSNEKDGVKTVSVVTGESLTLHSNVDDTQSDVSKEWMFDHLSIAKTDGKSNTPSYSSDVRFKNKLDVDIKTGDLYIVRSSTEHTGLYQLKIINGTYTIQKSFSVCVSCLSPAAVARICVGVIAGVVAVAAVAAFLICRRRCKKPRTIKEEKGQRGRRWSY
ncbi:uncharacterized protein LOC122327368 [Puntigrus tetrazona]|uniref:uncharacterized protein LOC122327368 n=1 Tax=Puntigrus tetrazona TaxID=1606681 RepID=UPI001C899B95|nr:uncharacterized protein LOC122327368 [Puntigrus tetrazona]